MNIKGIGTYAPFSDRSDNKWTIYTREDGSSTWVLPSGGVKPVKLMYGNNLSFIDNLISEWGDVRVQTVLPNVTLSGSFTIWDDGTVCYSSDDYDVTYYLPEEDDDPCLSADEDIEQLLFGDTDGGSEVID